MRHPHPRLTAVTRNLLADRPGWYATIHTTSITGRRIGPFPTEDEARITAFAHIDFLLGVRDEEPPWRQESAA